MNTIFLEPNDVPDCIRNAFGGYKGRKYKVVPCTHITLHDNHWSGGSKTEYRGVDLATGKVYLPSQPEHGNAFTPEAPTITLEPGKAIVAHSIFMGRDSGITVYLHHDNVAKLIKDDTPGVSGISDDEETVLAYTKARKSSYGGISNYRFYSASQDTGITIERWNSAKAALISKGLLNKAGAITVAGKNTVLSKKVY